MNTQDMNLLKEFEIMSRTIGVRQDYIQGGGGNTSVKFGEGLMAIKASGYKLKDIDAAKGGFAVVNKDKVFEFINTVKPEGDTDYEKVCSGVIKENIVELPGYEVRKPSVETGFHSVLKRFVAHSHSVYSNILCCTEEGRSLMEKLIIGAGIDAVFVPYTMPGFWLTLSIKQIREDYKKVTGRDADVIFMENHGVIATADTAEATTELHEKVNMLLKKAFDCPDFPVVAVKAEGERFVSDTPWLCEKLKAGVLNSTMMGDYLYPDHIAYIAPGDVSFTDVTAKIYMDAEAGRIYYRCNVGEASTLEETIAGIVFVNEGIAHANLTKQSMTPEAIHQISNWDAEKYRKAVTSGK